ncbi:DUF4352 domain-containing protein [Streptomyces palmae]|uniref:DUF4352 domain-containing protein n=1 Tax=Streptomyces palmae TaxID=1701085 RepID=A0A4Z0HDZ9_9ACTN|nr:DUF4352 domain-containing protein [Streptomyces palmae]TGB13733.1 DUF4352 domain-containing protein [Streptomyces palmae]
MRTRTIAALAVFGLLPLTAACGSGGDNDSAADKPPAQAGLDCSDPRITHVEWVKRCQNEKAGTDGEKPAETAAGKALGLGESGTFTLADSESGKKTTFQVTVDETTYIDEPAEVDTTLAAKGRYLRLGLTLKNVGENTVHLLTYGEIEWENADTAAQDATTLVILDGPELDTTYKPGQAVTGKLVLDVPQRGGVLNYTEGSGFTIKLPR